MPPVWTEDRLAGNFSFYLNNCLLLFIITNNFIELKLVDESPMIEEKWPIWDKKFDDMFTWTGWNKRLLIIYLYWN